MVDFNEYFFDNFNYHIEKILTRIYYTGEFEFGDTKFGFFRDKINIQLSFLDTQLPRITDKVYHEVLPPKPKFRIVGDELIPSSTFGMVQSKFRTIEKRLYHENTPLKYLIEIPGYDVTVKPKLTASKIDSLVYNDIMSKTVTEWTHHGSYVEKKVDQSQLRLELEESIKKMFSEIPSYLKKNSDFISENKVLESL
jgi:hypothetical protein